VESGGAGQYADPIGDDVALVRSYRTRFEAEVAASLIAGEGIRVCVLGDVAESTYPGLMPEYSIDVVVPRGDLERAREIVASDAPAGTPHFPSLTEFAEQGEAERAMALLSEAGLKAELTPPLSTHLDDVGFIVSVAPTHMGAAVRLMEGNTDPAGACLHPIDLAPAPHESDEPFARSFTAGVLVVVSAVFAAFATPYRLVGIGFLISWVLSLHFARKLDRRTRRE
jgi:hypothetical protein